MHMFENERIFDKIQELKIKVSYNREIIIELLIFNCSSDEEIHAPDTFCIITLLVEDKEKG